MNRKTVLLSVLLVLTLVVSACGGAGPTATPSPAPVLEFEDETFRNETSGYSIRFPLGWKHIDLRQIGTDLFHAPGEPSEEIVAGDVIPTVPLVVIAGGLLETMLGGSMEQTQDAQEMLDEIVAGVSENEDFSEGEVQEFTVAGQAALAVDVGWSENGIEVAGRFVAIHMGDHGYIIQAVGAVEGWQSFVPTLEAMLASMAVFEPVPPILLPEDFVGEGFFISFPEGWRVYFVEEQTIFSARQEYLELDIPPVPVVLVDSGAVDTLFGGQVAEAQNAREMLGAIVEVYRATGKDYEFGEIQDVTISEYEGASMSLRWDEDGTLALTQITAIQQGDRGLIIQAVGTVEGWQTFTPIYEEMMNALVILPES